MSLPRVVLPPGIPACVLQRVREDGDETGIVRRRCGAVRAYLFAGKEDSLRRPYAAVRLDPAATRVREPGISSEENGSAAEGVRNAPR
jgi:hypothetical protein